MRTPLPLRPDDPTDAGPFRLLGRLASGGMGVVYLARREDRPESLVAMKLMRREHAGQPVMRERFRSEVAATRRLAAQPATTTHVARLVAADADAGRPWLATEFVPGPSIADAVAERRLGDHEVVDVARALAEALVALHSEGLVHGDVKPANVVLGPDGVRLVDLGLSRDADEPLRHVMGSPGWAAPEQHSAAHDGMPADVFGWAITVAFAARGAHPFGSGTPEEITARMGSGAALLDDVPAGLRDVVAAALASDPDARPTADGVVRRLEAVVAPSDAGRAGGVDARPAPTATAALVSPTLVEDTDLLPWGSTGTGTAHPRRRARGALVGAAVMAVAAAVGGAFVAVGISERPGPQAEPVTATSASASASASAAATTPPAATPSRSAAPSPTAVLATTGKASAGGSQGQAPGKAKGKGKDNGKGGKPR